MVRLTEFCAATTPSALCRSSLPAGTRSGSTIVRPGLPFGSPSRRLRPGGLASALRRGGQRSLSTTSISTDVDPLASARLMAVHGEHDLRTGFELRLHRCAESRPV